MAKLRGVARVQCKAQKADYFFRGFCPEIAFLEEVIQLQWHQLAHVAHIEQIQLRLQKLLDRTSPFRAPRQICKMVVQRGPTFTGSAQAHET
jgi:hypothetical protein